MALFYDDGTNGLSDSVNLPIRTLASFFILLVAGLLLASSIASIERVGSGIGGEHVEYRPTGGPLVFGALGSSLGVGWFFARRPKR